MKKDKKGLKGIIEIFCETGTEGLIWSFYENGKKGWDGFHLLEAGNHLTIYNKDSSIAFQGMIIPDHKIGLKKIPFSNYRQPSALGYWIHWTQKGWKPDDWAKLFFGQPPLRAILIKK